MSVEFIVFFWNLSFSIQDYILFIFILALTGYAGANIGRRVISTIPFDSFNIVLKLLLTFLSIFLII